MSVDFPMVSQESWETASSIFRGTRNIENTKGLPLLRESFYFGKIVVHCSADCTSWYVEVKHIDSAFLISK